MFITRRHHLVAAAVTSLVLMTRAGLRAQSEPDDPVPDAAELLDRMVEAMGGAEAVRRHTHRTVKGTFELLGQFSDAEFVIRQAAPDLRVMSIEVPGQGTIRSGTDGETVWRIGPDSGPQLLEGKRRDRAIRDADCFAMLHYQRDHRDIRTAGMREFAGRLCYELMMTEAGGDELSLFIDAETYRIAGEIGTYPGSRGVMAMRTIFEMYEQFDGEWVAVKSRTNIGAFHEQIVEVEHVSFEPFDHSVFDLPQSIVELQANDGRDRDARNGA